MKNYNKNKSSIKRIWIGAKGITLITLVVTIIVLLILSGVAINLTIGQNGIFGKAQDTVNTWRNAETNEQLALQGEEDLIDSYIIYNTGETVIEAKKQNKFFDKDTTIKDDLLNDVRIPEGFKISADSGTKVEEGIVIEDKDGNQFVWIPAKTGVGVTIHTEAKGDVAIVYQRVDYGKRDSNYSGYFEIMPSDEEESVNANGGYYIGRFETGDKESTEAKLMRMGLTENKTVTIKKDQVPYNYVALTDTIILAEGMSAKQGYNAKTKLTSSFAWDTAISLIQVKHEEYGNSSIEGNYYDTTFKYRDITGTEQIKVNNFGLLVPTGQTTSLCNIYDMGGNLWEYTTECDSSAGNSYVSRSGSYGTYYAGSPAGYRFDYNGNAHISCGFRIALFMQS